MKQFDELTPKQQVTRKNAFKIALYGAFALVLFWSMYKMVGLEEEKQAQYSRIEDTMMEFYKETKEQTDTVGMSLYMREHLSTDDLKAWQQQGK